MQHEGCVTVLCCSWSLTHHALDDLVFAVVLLHLQQVVAEVEDVEASLLAQESDDHAARPVEAVSKALPGEQEGANMSEGPTT